MSCRNTQNRFCPTRDDETDPRVKGADFDSGGVSEQFRRVSEDLKGCFCAVGSAQGRPHLI